jgi:hypothetical protein
MVSGSRSISVRKVSIGPLMVFLPCSSSCSVRGLRWYRAANFGSESPRRRRSARRSSGVTVDASELHNRCPGQRKAFFEQVLQQPGMRRAFGSHYPMIHCGRRHWRAGGFHLG